MVEYLFLQKGMSFTLMSHRVHQHQGYLEQGLASTRQSQVSELGRPTFFCKKKLNLKIYDFIRTQHWRDKNAIATLSMILNLQVSNTIEPVTSKL